MNFEKNKNAVVALVLLGLVSTVACMGIWSGSVPVQGLASGSPSAKSKSIKIALVRGVDQRGARVSQIGTEGIEGLMDALEARGSKVKYTEVEENGVATLRVTVDGLQLSPIVTNCKECEPIVFEY